MPVDSVIQNRLMPRFSEIRRYIIKTIEVANSFSVKITFSEMPLCYLKGYEKYSFELNYFFSGIEKKEIISPTGEKMEFKKGMQKLKAKPLKCKSCKYFYICEGPWQEYLRLYGDSEFKPIRK